MPAVALFAAFAVLILFVSWLAWRRRIARREQLLVFAAQNGLEYSRSDPFGLLSYGFRLFSLGDGRGIENVVSGDWKGLQVKAADFWYYTQSTDGQGTRSKSYHRFSIVVADLAASCPGVSIEPETLATTLADHLGFRDIDFELEEFNRRFNVKAADREFAYQLVDARMIGWLMSLDGGWGFEVRGPSLLVHGPVLSPSLTVMLLGMAWAFRDHVPRMVWNAYGSPGGSPAAVAPNPPPTPTERSSA